MSGKVIHLSDEIHSKMMDFCKEHNMSASRWVESLIDDAIQRTTITVVDKKQLPKQEDNINQDDLWSKPPFWRQDKYE